MMKNLNLKLLVVFMAIGFTGCFKPDKTVYDNIETMLENAIENIVLVQPEELNEMIEVPASPFVIIDVREPNEFEAGHIPGAINIPRGTLEFSNLLTNRRQTVVLYSNTHQRAALSVKNLELLKYDDIRVLEGGLQEWQEVFPDKIEEGPGSMQASTSAKQVSSGGCGD